MTTAVERTPLAVERGQAELFLDDERIAERNNVTRRWHRLRKHPANPLFSRSGEEAQVYLSGTVLREPEPGGGEPLFRMWYYARSEKVRWVAYARSRDGIRWEKPDLGVLPAGRGLPGNAIFAPPGWRLIDFSGLVKDPRPGAADEERYKLIVSADTRGAVEVDEPLEGLEGKHFVRGTSPDGWRWTFHGAFKPAMPTYPDRGCLTWDPFRGRVRPVRAVPPHAAGAGRPGRPQLCRPRRRARDERRLRELVGGVAPRHARHRRRSGRHRDLRLLRLPRRRPVDRPDPDAPLPAPPRLHRHGDRPLAGRRRLDAGGPPGAARRRRGGLGPLQPVHGHRAPAGRRRAVGLLLRPLLPPPRVLRLPRVEAGGPPRRQRSRTSPGSAWPRSASTAGAAWRPGTTAARWSPGRWSCPPASCG